MILVLDNYDSFTYNLVQYLGELGATMRVARNDKITIEEIHIHIIMPMAAPRTSARSQAMIAISHRIHSGHTSTRG